MKSIINNPKPVPEVIKETHKLIKGVVERLENQKVNTAISLFMSYVNYIVKKQPEGLDKDSLCNFITLLAPFVPHFTEEVWELMGNTQSIFEMGHWPEYDIKIAEDSTVQIPVGINGKVRDIITLGRDASKEEAIARAKSSEIVKSFIEGNNILKEIYIPQKTINFVIK